MQRSGLRLKKFIDDDALLDVAVVVLRGGRHTAGVILLEEAAFVDALLTPLVSGANFRS